MPYQATFARYEIKYLLSKDEKDIILQAMAPYMVPDYYGRTTIRNIYYDTSNYRLIRHSLEHPVYKEKLRIRSYRPAGPKDPVFLELKKKYNGIVYKRRITMPRDQAIMCIHSGLSLPTRSQIADEIDYFRLYYDDLRPSVYLSYDRESYISPDGSGLRVTFDDHIQYRQEDFSLEDTVSGTPLLDKDHTLMEIKTPGGFPLWMTHTLTRERIFKTSFSKYGRAYQDIMSNTQHKHINIGGKQDA